MDKFKSMLRRAEAFLSDYFSAVRQGVKNIGRDNITLLASGMVYSTLIAIVPCITFLSAFLSAFGSLEPFLGVLSEWICDTFGTETGTVVSEAIMRFSGSAMSLGVVGLVSFVITGMFLVNKIYSLVNYIFRTEPTEGTMKRLMLILIFLIVLTVVITFGVALSSSFHDKIYSLMGQDVKNGIFKGRLGSLIQYLIVFLVFFVVITAVPNAKVRPSTSIPTAVLGTFLTFFSTFVFTRIISYMVGYSVIYGSMASVLFVLLYLYLVWYLVVLVLEVAYVHQFRPDKSALLGRAPKGEKMLADALDVMLLVAGRYEDGKGSTAIRDLSLSLSLPVARINDIIADLEGAGLIIAVNNTSSSFFPSRPSSSIMVSELVDAVFSIDCEVKTEGRIVARKFRTDGLSTLSKKSIKELLEEKNDN
ncbi:MAG: YihY/virulence factor BrkB family protein [Candidatus Ornithospirochaeta sp.]